MRHWRGSVIVVALLLLVTACGESEDMTLAGGGDATATFEAARASLLQERSAQATQTAEVRPTRTPAPPSPTPTSTPVPTATPTPTPSPTPITEPVVVLYEDFEDDVDLALWTGSDGWLQASIVDGEYYVTLDENSQREFELIGLEGLADASIQADLRFEGTGSIGFYARTNGARGGGHDRGYHCALRYDGTLWCTHTIAGESQCLCTLDAYFTGFEGTHTLTLTAVGNTLQIALNGQVLTTVEDWASDYGSWGLMVHSRDTLGFRAWFDNIVVTKYPAGYPLN